MMASLRPAVLPSAACTYHSYCCVQRRETRRIANSLTSRGSELPNRRYVPMRAALIISCGLRLSGTKGPKTACFRSTRNSAAAFFCPSVSLSAGIGGSLSCAKVGVAKHTISAARLPTTACRLLPAALCPPSAFMSSSQFSETAGEALDSGFVHKFVARAIFLEIAADDQAVHFGQQLPDILRRRAASDQQRQRRSAPDDLDIGEARFHTRAVAGHDDRVDQPALLEISRLDIEAAAGDRCRVFDPDVGKNERARLQRASKSH